MPITYTPPGRDEDLHASNLRTEKARLEKLDKQIAALEAQAAADPYLTPPRLALASLKPLRNELAYRLRQHEANHSAATGSRDVGHAALTAGSYFSGSDY